MCDAKPPGSEDKAIQTTGRFRGVSFDNLPSAVTFTFLWIGSKKGWDFETGASRYGTVALTVHIAVILRLCT